MCDLKVCLLHVVAVPYPARFGGEFISLPREQKGVVLWLPHLVSHCW